MLALAIWIVERFTTFGFALRAVGANARAAAFAGLPVARTLILGALLPGRWQARGRWRSRRAHQLPDPRHVAGLWLFGHRHRHAGGAQPLGVILAAIFVASVLVGADSMSRCRGTNYLADDRRHLAAGHPRGGPVPGTAFAGAAG